MRLSRFISLSLLLTISLVGCFTLPPQDCGITGRTISGHVVRRIAPNTTNLEVVGIPNAQVELVSIQTKFDCPDAFGAERTVLKTDQVGAFKGSLAFYDEDLFRVIISAEGCIPFKQEPVGLSFFDNAGIYTLVCEEMLQTTPTFSQQR